MATTQQEINFSKLKSSYSLKGKTTINPINFEGGFTDNVKSISASGSTLTVVLNNDKKFKLTGISNPNTIKFAGDYTDSLQEFYNDKFTTSFIPAKGTKVSATVFDENIDVSAFVATAKNAAKNIGLTINAGAGDDVIKGTKYNDKITGGAGENILNYAKGDGNDVVTLTKGENFTLNMTDLTLNDLKFERVKNDLKISYNKGGVTGSVTLKNFVSKDVTNNSNVKKKIADTSSVTVNTTDTTLDLREDLLFGGKNKITVNKNYTGSWLAEEIDAGSYNNTKNKGLTINAKGGDDIITGTKYADTIKGGVGDDIITGGTGNDKLYGEDGKNTLIFSKGDGNDIVYGGKGEDTLKFTDAIDLTFEVSKKDLVVKYNYTENKTGKTAQDSVTIKNYYDKKGNITSSVKYVELYGKTYELEKLRTAINNSDFKITNEDYITSEQDKDKDKIVIAQNDKEHPIQIITKNGDDVIIASENGAANIDAGNGNNTVHGGNGGTITTGTGNDVIYSGNSSSINAGAGNDEIHLQKESNEIHFAQNHGKDTVIFEEKQKNGNTVVFDNKTLAQIEDKNTGMTFTKEGDDLTTNFKNDSNNSVTYKDYFAAENQENVSETTIKGSDGNTKSTTLDDLMSKATITVKGSGDIEGTKYNDVVTGSSADDVITAGKGDDTISGGAGQNTFVFNKNDGKDTITDAKKDDVIKFDFETDKQPEISFVDNKLVVKINDNNSVTTNFNYNNASNNIDKILVKDNSQPDGYREISIKETAVFEKTLTNGQTYNKQTPYAENINIAEGAKNVTITKMGENDSLHFEDNKFTYSRTNGGGLVINNAVTVSDFNFDGNHDITINNGTTENMELQVTLTGNYNYTSTGYKETFTGSGTVSNLSADDKILFAEGTNTSYTINNSGITVSGGGNTIVAKGKTAEDLKENIHVVVGNNADDVSQKTLTVTGVNNFDGSNLGFKNYIVTGTEGADNIVGGNNDDTLTGGKGDDTLKGGKGNDTLTGGEGKNTFVFNAGDGTDIIKDAKKDDVIQIDSSTNFEITKNNENKLQISYSGGTVIVDNYDFNSTNNVDVLKVKKPNGTYETFSIKENFFNPINGTDGNDTLNGTANNDIITGNKGDDTINAGLGRNTIFYNPGDGNDTIKSGGGIDTIKFAAGTNVVAALSGDNDIQITYSGIVDGNNVENTITIENYQTDENHSVKYVQIGDSKQRVVESYLPKIIDLGVNTFENLTFSRGEGDSTDLTVTKPYWSNKDQEYKYEVLATVTDYFENDGGKFVMADTAPTQFRLSNGNTYHLEWRVSPGKGVEGMYNIVDGTGSYLKGAEYIQGWYVANDSNNSIMSSYQSGYDVMYGTDGRDQYFATSGSNGGEIYAGAGDDEIFASSHDDIIDGGAGKDKISPNQGNNTIYFRLGESDGDTIIPYGGKDTFVFDSGTMVSCAWGEENSTNANDMIITCTGTKDGNNVTDRIILKDFKTNTSAGGKYIQIGDGQAKTLSKYLPAGEGTNGDDEIDIPAGGANCNLMAGNDTLNFGADFGNTTVSSTRAYTSGHLNKTTMNIGNYSLTDGTLNVSMSGEGDTYNMVLTAKSKDGKHGGTITVNNFASDEQVANVVINDADTTWNAYGYEAFKFPPNMISDPGNDNYLATGTTSTPQENLNNIFVIKNGRDDQTYGNFYFDSASNAERKNIVATSGNINLTYFYNSNNKADDKVITTGGDDTYEIGKLTNDTRINVTDFGGNDTLAFETNLLEKIRLLFNVNADGTYDNVNMKVVHTNMIDSANFKDVYKSSDLGINITANALNGQGEGIERLVAQGHTVQDVTEWKQAVASKVSTWLKNNSFTDVNDALSRGSNAKITELYNLFDVDYASNLTSTVISSTNCKQLIMNQIWGAGNNLFGTDESEFLLGTSSTDEITEDRVFTGKGDDTVQLTKDRVIWYNGTHTIPDTYMYFKPGDGNDTITNSEIVATGDSLYSYSDKQVEISEGVRNGRSDTRLNFIGVEASNISAKQDGNDIVITYTGKDENNKNTSDTIRIKNGFYSTNVNEIWTWDKGNRGSTLMYGDGELNDWYDTPEQKGYSELENGYGTKPGDDGYSSPVAKLNLQDILTIDAINKGTAVSGQEIKGWMWDDTITGSAYADTIYAYNGADIVNAGAGNDTIYGGYGDDVINGEAGDDTIEDTDGVNTIHGGEGNDTITASGVVYGDGGNDVIKGSGKIYGGDGNDKLISRGPIAIEGDNAYIQLADGGAGDDEIIIQGDNYMTCNVEILGGDGADTLSAEGQYWDSSAGGSYKYKDTFYYNPRLEGTINMGAGNDHIALKTYSAGPLTVDGGVGDDVIEIGAPDEAEYYKNLTIKNSGGHDSLSLLSSYQRASFDYFTYMYKDYNTPNQDVISKVYAPVAFFDMEKVNGQWTYGNDIYITSTAPRNLYTDNGRPLIYDYVGDKENSIKIENGLVEGHTMDIYIKNSEYVSAYIEYDRKNGYRVLNVENLKAGYEATLTELGYTSLAAAMAETDENKLLANKQALAAVGMSEDVWTYTFERPLEFSVVQKDGSDEYNTGLDMARGNGANNLLVANLVNAAKGNNYLVGTSANEFLYSIQNGDDIIRAGAGNDVIYGGRGDDEIYAGAGNNRIVFNKDSYLYAGYSSGWPKTYSINEDVEAPTQQYNYDTQQYEWTIVDLSDGNDTVYSDGGVDTLDFTENNMVKFEKSGRDLKINYAFDKSDNATGTVTVKDYFLANGNIDPNHSAKYINFKSRGTVALADEYNDYVDGGKFAWGTSGNNYLRGDGGTIKYIYGGAGNDTLGAAQYLDGGIGNDIYEVLAQGSLTVISDSGYPDYSSDKTKNYISLADVDRNSFRGFADVTATKVTENAYYYSNGIRTDNGDSVYLFSSNGDYNFNFGVRVDTGYKSLLNENFDLSGLEAEGVSSQYINVNKSNIQNDNYRIKVAPIDEFHSSQYTDISTIRYQTANWLSNNYDALDAAGLVGDDNSISSMEIMTNPAAAAFRDDLTSSISNYLNSSYSGWSANA